MKTLQDLASVRERSRVKVDIRTRTADTCFIVSMTRDSIDAGARDVTKAIVREVGSRGLNGVAVIQDGNMVSAGVQPIVRVLRPGHEEAVLTGVTVDEVPRIVQEFLPETNAED